MSPREAQKATAGTFGAGVDVRAGGLRVGNATRLSEWRTEGQLHYAPTSGYRFRLAIPVLARQMSGVDVDTNRRPFAGDATVSMDARVSEARDGRLSRTLALTIGLALPTAPAVTDDHGAFLPSILQPGCNAIVPEALLSYRLARGTFSLVSTPRMRLPIPVREAPHRGASVGLGVTGQWQPHPRFATRLGTTVRYELEGADATGHGDGVSGGLVTYLSPEIAVRPTLDLMWTIGVFAPVLQASAGGQRETVVFATSLGWDI